MPLPTKHNTGWQQLDGNEFEHIKMFNVEIDAFSKDVRISCKGVNKVVVRVISAVTFERSKDQRALIKAKVASMDTELAIAEINEYPK